MSERRAGLSWAMAALGFWAAWLGTMAVKLPMIWYLPLEYRFDVGVKVPGLAMGFYGQLINAALVSACTGAVTWALVRKRQPTPAQLWAAVVACALLLCIATGFIGAGLWGRLPD